jgi:hypothetical protein
MLHRWTALAFAAHGALLAMLFVVPLRRSREAASSPSSSPAEITVTLENETESEPIVARTERAVVREASSSIAIATRGETTGVATVPGAAAAPSAASSNERASGPPAPEAAPGTPGPAPSTSGGVVVNPIPLTLGELGIAGRNPFLPRAEEKAPTGADHPAARAMRGSGLAHDRELGLGPEGPAIAALSDATTSSIAPLRGRALFIVRTGGDGLVSAIDLVDSEGGTGWMDAGRIALERLRGKKLAVPRGAAGMNMRIEVRSELKLPNGESAPFGTRRGDNDMPEMTIPDVSNIGVKPRRVVHARAAGTDVL